MVELTDDLNAYVKDTFSSNWSTRKSQSVPEPSNLKSSNDAFIFDRATVLYADICGSTAMVNNSTWWDAGAVYKSFLYCAARLITDNGGTISAYDGDRIMGVFVGEVQSTPAVITALKIHSAVKNTIMPALKTRYPGSDFKLRHVVGIDTSPIQVAKVGVRGENDLVWIGKAANYAAKLTELSSDFQTWITGELFDALLEDGKIGGNPKRPMWTQDVWKEMSGARIYKSNWWW